MNAFQVPIGLASMALLPVVVLMGRRRRELAGLGALAATVIVALVANAAVCAIISGPHPRYGARLAWLASLTIVMVPLRLQLRRPAGAVPAASGTAAAVRIGWGGKTINV